MAIMTTYGELSPLLRALLPDRVGIRTNVLPPIVIDVDKISSGQASGTTKLLINILHPRIGIIKENRAMEYDLLTRETTYVDPTVYADTPATANILAGVGIFMGLLMLYGAYSLWKDLF